MVKNGETAEAVASSISTSLSETIPAALEAAMDERGPARPADLVAYLTAFTALVGQNWTPDGREEFIGVALGELLALPAQMTIDALVDARRKVNDGRHLITFVCERIEGKLRRLDEEIQRLEYLNGLLPKA